MLLPAITRGAPLERESAVEADAINIWPRCGQIPSLNQHTITPLCGDRLCDLWMKCQLKGPSGSRRASRS